MARTSLTGPRVRAADAVAQEANVESCHDAGFDMTVYTPEGFSQTALFEIERLLESGEVEYGHDHG